MNVVIKLLEARTQIFLTTTKPRLVQLEDRGQVKFFSVESSSLRESVGTDEF